MNDLKMPDDFIGKTKKISQFTKSVPREWTKNEINWMVEQLDSGSTIDQIAAALGRTKISVQTKIKRMSKNNDDYNSSNRELKYVANKFFIDSINPKTVLDVYAGNSFYSQIENIDVVTNDIDEKFQTDYSLDSLKLLCELYLQGKKFDVIDIDPYGSAYECFDLAIKMAKKGIIVSFGEWGHRRWKRVDFVRPRYGIKSVDEFVPDVFISEFQRIAICNHKTATVFDVLQYGNFLRVYFTLEKYKTTEQWGI